MSLVLGRTAADEAARISGRPVFVLPNCLDEDGRPGPAPPRVGTPFRILFLANLQESKGILTLLESAPAIVRARPEVRFRIAGPWQDNTLREKAFAFVRENGLEPFVEWLGPVAGRAKEELFLTSHLFVLPSRNETMSLAVLEAMRAALPVVTTDRGVLPEVVLDGRTGFIIPPADPGLLEARILALVDRPAEAAAMGKAGRDRFLAEYSYPAFRERVSSLLRETLGARP
jgi:glycosyltransferase involved in cell wall biosynthesis